MKKHNIKESQSEEQQVVGLIVELCYDQSSFSFQLWKNLPAALKTHLVFHVFNMQVKQQLKDQTVCEYFKLINLSYTCIQLCLLSKKDF